MRHTCVGWCVSCDEGWTETAGGRTSSPPPPPRAVLQPIRVSTDEREEKESSGFTQRKNAARETWTTEGDARETGGGFVSAFTFRVMAGSRC